MKNIWLKSALIAVAGFSAASCADFLNITPEDLIVEDNYWDEKNDVNQVLTGCYTRMQDGDFLNRAFVWGEVRADNVGIGNTKAGAPEYEILQENILSTNAYTSWTPFYAVINRCNLVIDRAPKVAEKDPNFKDSEVRATIAEATGLRALCYFYLVRTFKEVPYYTYAITSDDQALTLPATDGNEILDMLLEDLLRVQGDASLKFLDGSRDVTCGRMSRVGIWALIADISLWRHKYDQAIEYADRVIAYKNRFNPYSPDYDATLTSGSSSSGSTRFFNKSYYAGTSEGVDVVTYFPLLDDRIGATNNYGAAFSAIFGDGNSVESIFELNFESTTESDNKKNNDMVDLFFRRYTKRTSGDAAEGCFVPSLQFTNEFDFASNTLGQIFLGWTTTPSSSEAVCTPDARFLESVYFANSTKGTAGGSEMVKYNWSDYSVSLRGQVSGGAATYYNYGTVMARTGLRNSANWIFYRVSDMMLIKAEAIANAYPGNEARLREAFALVQAINDRSNSERSTNANASSLNFETGGYSNAETLKRLVLNERRREFLFEGKRWFDLVRWSLNVGNTDDLKRACTVKMPNGPTSGSGKLTNMNAMYFPYNKGELQTNPNLKQNPAYPEVDNDNYESTK